MKKILAIILAFALLLTYVTVAFGQIAVNHNTNHSKMVNDHQKRDPDPYCFAGYRGYYLGLCGPTSSTSCIIYRGSVWGGKVYCRHKSKGYISCFISWPFCTAYY